MRKTHRDKRKYYQIASLLLLLVFLLTAAFFFINLWEKEQGEFSGQNGPEENLTYEGKEYELRDNIETFLVLGLDKFEGSDGESYSNHMQADFLMLFVFDHEAKVCSAIHINRDTMAWVNRLDIAGKRLDSQYKQIALAHTEGNGKEVSCRNTADAVSSLLMGMRIDHYASVTMDSVAVMNDLVDGVTVTLLEDFTHVDPTMKKGETLTLRGEQALSYVRSRQGMEDSSNTTRMVRQRQYLNALREKTVQCIEADENFIVNSTVKMADYLVSDRSLNQLQDLLTKFSAYEFVEMNEIEGESKTGEQFMEFYPDEDALTQAVITLFYRPKD